jgi:hypothetical protein
MLSSEVILTSKRLEQTSQYITCPRLVRPDFIIVVIFSQRSEFVTTLSVLLQSVPRLSVHCADIYSFVPCLPDCFAKTTITRCIPAFMAPLS